MLQNNPNLKSKIQELWDKFWSGGIANPLTAIEQITYLLFIRKIDDLDIQAKADAEWNGDKYTSKFDGTYTDKIPHDDERKPEVKSKEDLRWSIFKRMPADQMLNHVRYNVFSFIKELNGNTSPFTKYMANAVFVVEKPALLFEAIKVIDEIFEEMDKDSKENGQNFQDIQGDVYEYLLSEIASAGKNGQFRTPRHIIKLMAELVAPQLGQNIADPACGTGGFLLGAYQYIVTQQDKNKDQKEPDEDGFIRSTVSGGLSKEVVEILSKSIYGFDIDTTMVRLGLMNLMMHGIENPKIEYKDTLSKSYNENSFYDIIMANPPFTGSIDKGDINEILQTQTTKTELLFVERIYHMLKMGGTAGIVVPQGVLFGANTAFQQVRELIIEKAELKAVVTAPSGVFKPYAGVSTALLIFTKGGETKNVWFYNMESDGYTLDDKREKKVKGDYGDLQDIVAKYKTRKVETDTDRKQKYFFVSKSEIKENGYDLSYSKYKEDVYDEVFYEKPSAILQKINALELEIANDLKELEGYVND